MDQRCDNPLFREMVNFPLWTRGGGRHGGTAAISVDIKLQQGSLGTRSGQVCQGTGGSDSHKKRSCDSGRSALDVTHQHLSIATHCQGVQDRGSCAGRGCCREQGCGVLHIWSLHGLLPYSPGTHQPVAPISGQTP